MSEHKVLVRYPIELRDYLKSFVVWRLKLKPGTHLVSEEILNREDMKNYIKSKRVILITPEPTVGVPIECEANEVDIAIVEDTPVNKIVDEVVTKPKRGRKTKQQD